MNNLIFGMIVRNEGEMLRLTLPILKDVSIFKFALDTGSTDGTVTLLKEHGFLVGSSSWKSDFSAARNELIEVAKYWGAEGWIVMLDADECIRPEDFVKISMSASEAKCDLMSIPRYNLLNKGTLYDSGSYPDAQTRVVRLASNKRYRLPVHEVIDGPRHVLKDVNIYHYGWEKPPAENWLRSHRYAQISRNEPEIESPPAWANVDYQAWLEEMKTRHRFSEFTQDHPLKGKI